MRAPAPRLTPGGTPEPDQKPSTAAAMKSMTAAPKTTTATLLAVPWSEASRERSPGAIIDQPSASAESPARIDGARVLEGTSRLMMNVKMFAPAPWAATYPTMAPVISPFSTR